ncbi:arsenate reductase/protein-tyrosine-phosphatase family protein [Aeromicrobium senzhongii]|uniref:arsenate reductase/protein-tyrosine-phosphatase family protein n=1 Tax=Aeromicrobium senzhongii TaxID=2663859 RepID=UPI002101FC2C|nr:hypothetical protein [Aeromicrobium senzhongii]
MCRANLCRSPVAEFFAARELSDTRLSVSSVGTDAVTGQEICVRASDFLAEESRGREFAVHHRATRLSSKHSARSALIVTATPRERSLVAQLDPAARARTFTMVELERLFSLPEIATGPTDLETLVALLHRMRWQVANEHWKTPSRIALRKLASRRPLRGLSVQDAHASRMSIHPPVLNASRSLALAISEQLLSRIAGLSSPSGDPRRDELPAARNTSHAG